MKLSYEAEMMLLARISLLESVVYGNETFDARKEKFAWFVPGSSDEHVNRARNLFNGGHMHLGCQSSTLIREELPPFHLPSQPEPCEGYADYRGL